MIKNIIFDIGKVLVTFDPVSVFYEKIKNKEQTTMITGHIFGDEIWTKYDAGLVTMQDMKEYYWQKYPQEYEMILYILDHWTIIMKGIEASITYIKLLKKRGYKIYLLSNINEESAQYLKKEEAFFDYVDGAILSYQHHVVKPDPKIYHLLLDTYHLEPTTCVFLDDRKENIDVARQLHMNGIVFTNPAQAFLELEELLKREETAC